MNTGPYRIEWRRLTASSGDFWGLFGISAAQYFKSRLVWLSVVLAAGVFFGLGGSALLWDDGSAEDQSQPVQLMTAAEFAPVPAEAPAREDPSLGPEIAPQVPSPVDNLKISSQRWRRGGLGSNALVSFTLRNPNDYAVKDIEISCAFSRRDGSHLTDRARVIRDTIGMKGRKTFAWMHIGFVNVNADRVKCAAVTASRI